MATSPRLLLALCLTMPLVFAGCEEDTTEKTKNGLFGRWELYRGFRNRQQTETLAGVYFEFDPNGKMKTNLPVVSEEPIDYELSKNMILQKGTRPINYEIRQLADSNLVLVVELRGMPFELHLRKAAPATPIDSSGTTPPIDTLSGGQR